MQPYHYPAKGIILFITLLAAGCSLDNFQNPLPVDRPNIYVFPKIMQGYWVNDEDRQHLYLTDKFLQWSTKDTIKIIRGVWPKNGADGKPMEPPFGFYAERYQSFDSLTNRMDTSTGFFFNSHHVFEEQKKGLLSKGYTYTSSNDSVVMYRYDTGYMDMGKNMFIKDMGQGLYALNINTVILGIDNRFWQLVLLQVKNAGQVEYWKAAEKMITRPERVYYYEEKYESAGYYDCKWTASQIRQLMKDGYFEKVAVFSRIKKGSER